MLFVEWSNFGKNKWTTLVFVLVIIVWGMLIAGMATPWYKITVRNDAEPNPGEYSIYFYAPKILAVTKLDKGDEPSENDLGWDGFDLTKVHNIINTNLAFAALAWLTLLAVLVMTFLVQVNIARFCPGGVSMWLITKIMIAVAALLILICIAVQAGLPGGFKDSTQADNPNRRFTQCDGTCDDSWSGSEGNTKWGPGTGWIITIVSFFVCIAAAIVPWVLKDGDITESTPKSSPAV
ncbi:hypothetical protein DFA_11645 [Cavenderia fasciculata]|uniref:Transmembrane protein n=1 Tax=Cavenderia fasciculata TaxID=261658 RepID=F4QDT7_CACFS|nr:uncharacterized protein DFA_11645 [Cavenderia fasciculata]EGG13884.1 hypothetical protein DFA_11645 [Cavenderia fasciculata]|eukprot:XP_004350592.1 hypothetical protein DFA_11645 [Cavenderia fasciculata]